ncbi:MAG: hypothetical protein JXR77_18950 [Lentisphaeria bacterium]|nr:hypothetical protein [Lentisphaeria bacterium]
MAEIPRTQIEGLSFPRLMAGTNWFLGYSHQTAARSRMIKEMQSRQTLADILEVFFAAGGNAVYGGRPDATLLEEAIRDAEDRTGRPGLRICIPSFDLADTPAARDANLRTLDAYRAIGCNVLMPHQATTDALVDRRTRSIREMDFFLPAIRERGMIPGLSTHMPETPVYADEMGLDVGTYIQIYNAAGFLMQIEIDWVQRMIWNRRKPVITIKPLAAGRVQPLVGLAFCWATLRPIDMVCIGCLTADEAREVIDISMALLEHRAPGVALQETRSKASMKSGG